MPRASRAFNHTRVRRTEHKRLLIVTEGVKTEVQYFEGLVQYLRSTGAAVRGVRKKGIGKDPERVLQAAIDLDAADPDGYDELWVVVDVDEHTTLDSALARARRLKIPVVVSNPCFEIWLVWHYEDCAAYQCTGEAIGRLSRYGHSDKQVPNSFPYAAHADAARRAGTAVCVGDRGPNPSTSMAHLVAALTASRLT